MLLNKDAVRTILHSALELCIAGIILVCFLDHFSAYELVKDMCCHGDRCVNVVT